MSLPCHPNNLFRVRLLPEAEGKLLPEFLYLVLLYLFQSGAFKAVSRGSVQQHMTIRDVQDVLRQINPAYRWLTKVRSGAKDLEVGDVLLQRVGTCGRPFRVTNLNPLTIQASE